MKHTHDRREPRDTEDEFSALRAAMVTEQLAERGIHDLRVLSAMAAVPRENFVPAEMRSEAYLDCALPIECHQTISQPYTVAYMCQALHLQGDERVLEVGTGSGYGAAVLSLLAAEVVTVERIPRLASIAAERLASLGYDNVHVHVADGTLGWPLAAPYDAIVVTAGAAALPPAYLEQLKSGGRIVIPIGTLYQGQTMCRFTRRGHDTTVEKLGAFAFVPLIGKQGWKSAEESAAGSECEAYDGDA